MRATPPWSQQHHSEPAALRTSSIKRADSLVDLARNRSGKSLSVSSLQTPRLRRLFCGFRVAGCFFFFLFLGVFFQQISCFFNEDMRRSLKLQSRAETFALCCGGAAPLPPHAKFIYRQTEKHLYGTVYCVKLSSERWQG